MQYVNKRNRPHDDWESWFSIHTDNNIRRSYDYKTDAPALVQLHLAKEWLLAEQSGLCAYCQKKLHPEDSSIEHIVPKGQNLELSTNYYNLVVVCDKPLKDSNGRSHCDKERGSKLLPNIILYKNAMVTSRTNHAYFDAYSDGQIAPKPNLPEEIRQQVIAFIEILNLNHELLVQFRKKDVLGSLLDEIKNIPRQDQKKFWKYKFDSIMDKEDQPFRQFLLIYIAKKMGVN